MHRRWAKLDSSTAPGLCAREDFLTGSSRRPEPQRAPGSGPRQGRFASLRDGLRPPWTRPCAGLFSPLAIGSVALVCRGRSTTRRPRAARRRRRVIRHRTASHQGEDEHDGPEQQVLPGQLRDHASCPRLNRPGTTAGQRERGRRRRRSGRRCRSSCRAPAGELSGPGQRSWSWWKDMDGSFLQ